MNIKRLKIRGARLGYMALIGFLMFVAPLFHSSMANAVTINKPTSAGINQPFQMRTSSRPHKGIDYNTNCGTSITTSAPVTCHMDADGWGAYALAESGCGVVELYAHLKVCQAGSTTVVTGGAPGAQGSGNSEGCHLHYELRINKCHVNPESAYGKDLCLEATKKPLIDEAKRILGSHATCSAGGGGDQVDTGPGPKPPPSGGDIIEIIYIPGTPGTPGKWEIKTYDGRKITIPDMRVDENPMPVLPPTTDELVPKAPSKHEITGCATDTWTAMVNQAVLETRREILFNNRHITKGDSVMAYSCFAEQAKKVGEELGPFFSESKLWVNRQVDVSSAKPSNSRYYPPVFEKIVTLNKELGENSLDGAVNIAGLHTYENWIRSNFNHSFLGGTLSDGGGSTDEADGKQLFMPCGVMNQIWQLAKCNNLTDEPPFPRFSELIEENTDPRKFPKNMSCKNTGITQKMINRAKQKEVDNSKLDPYIKMIYPAAGCHPAIKTGVTVERREGAGVISRKITYDDGVCVTMGCSYDRGGTCQ